MIPLRRDALGRYVKPEKVGGSARFYGGVETLTPVTWDQCVSAQLKFQRMVKLNRTSRNRLEHIWRAEQDVIAAAEAYAMQIKNPRFAALCLGILVRALAEWRATQRAR